MKLCNVSGWILTFTVLLAASAPEAGAQSKKEDWAQFYRYNEANATLSKRPLAVLMGDSITDNWLKMRPEFFSEHNLAGRGISGQTSSEMLVRFRRDVLDLKPKYVFILAGTNDAAENNGKITPENTLGNIISMCELAKKHKIKPVICSVLPAGHFRWRPAIEDAPDRVRAINVLLKAYAHQAHIPYLDYYSLLDDGNGSLSSEHSGDTVHPTPAGYEIMEAALLKML